MITARTIKGAGLRLLSLPLIALSLNAPADAQDKPSPYNGGEPVTQARFGNGAILNETLARDPFLKVDPRLIKVRDGIWTVTGYALSNLSFVESDAGLVVFDAGSNIGQGEYFLSQIRKVSQKPIVAIIYSHAHYIGGASVLAEGRQIPIYAHADLAANMRVRSLDQGPFQARRAATQFGVYLPHSGEDAAVTTPEPEFADPLKKRSAALPVTHPVKDGEEVVIGGVRFIFKWTIADTTDSLTVWLPDQKTVLTNTVTNMFYPLYTLRGEVYREPLTIISSYDTVRRLNADYYVPVHGDPVIGKDAILRRLTLHRDAYSFVYNQALRGLNQGWSPDQIVQCTHIPQRFLDEPTLNQVYSEFDYALRGVYRGLIGWFAEDTADLNPPSPMRLGKSIVDGFGGIQSLIAASKAALARNEYDLAAKLAGYAVDAEPDNAAARQAKADALRKLARVARGFQAYNFYLTEALDLESKVDRFAAPAFAKVGPEALTQLPASDLVRVLESRIDPIATRGVNDRLAIRFDDESTAFAIDVRDGVAEAGTNPANAGLALRTTKLGWANYLQGRISVAQLLTTEQISVEKGKSRDVEQFLHYFLPPSSARK